MKKIIVSLILIIIVLTGCSNKKEEFFLSYNNYDIKLDSVFDNNDYNDFFESENCAFGEKDITYIYDDIEIETYSNVKNELIIYSIRFTSENVKTNENIGLYDNIDKVFEVYGDDYIKEDNKYTYKHGKTSLIFITSNDIIESIEYTLNNMN